MNIDILKYKELVDNAIKFFWDKRNKQKIEHEVKDIQDKGNRKSVTGGKQLDGFLYLLKQIAIDLGIPKDCIYLKGNHLPGYFRSTKDWDLLIITPSGELVTVVELKSQVGSFGNNFNNRAEESIGSALDLWTAYRENIFHNQSAPWLGYLIIVEKSNKSSRKVKISEPHYKVFKEFNDSSYLERYKILCEKLMLERLYNQSCLIWSTNDYKYGNMSKETSLDSFLYSYIGHLIGKLKEFK